MIAIGLVIFLTVCLDQATKILIRETMVLGQSIPIIGEFFRITYVENPGIAFGIRVSNTLIFTILSILASIGIGVYLFMHRDESLRFRLALALILGGAFGNLIDRLLFNKVVDFFDVGIGNLRWPVFNIADSAVVIGMIILLITVFITEKKNTIQKQET